MTTAEARVNHDILCRACGYNLRGLAVAGDCPECATPVERSVRSDLLEFCDPAWVGGLARGLVLVIIGAVSSVVASVILVLAIAVLVPLGVSWTALIAAGDLIGAGTWIVIAIGVWMLTAPDPAPHSGSHSAWMTYPIARTSSRIRPSFNRPIFPSSATTSTISTAESWSAVATHSLGNPPSPAARWTQVGLARRSLRRAVVHGTATTYSPRFKELRETTMIGWRVVPARAQ